jgi:hypothetical protein
VIQQEKETVANSGSVFVRDQNQCGSFLPDSVLLEASSGWCYSSGHIRRKRREKAPFTLGKMCHAYVRCHYFI